jgi:hypothetical protein
LSSGKADPTVYTTGYNILCRKAGDGLLKDWLLKSWQLTVNSCDHALVLPNLHTSILPYSSYAGFLGTITFFSFLGLLLPNDPLKILPFLVFLSPLPMLFI